MEQNYGTNPMTILIQSASTGGKESGSCGVCQAQLTRRYFLESEKTIPLIDLIY